MSIAERNPAGIAVGLIGLAATLLGVRFLWFPSPGNALAGAIASAAVGIATAMIVAFGGIPRELLIFIMPMCAVVLGLAGKLWELYLATKRIWSLKPDLLTSQRILSVQELLAAVPWTGATDAFIRFKARGLMNLAAQKWVGRLYADGACFLSKGDLLGKAMLVASRDGLVVRECDSKLIAAGAREPVGVTLEIAGLVFNGLMSPPDVARLTSWHRLQSVQERPA
jgi:hypothetical protein